MNTLYYGDNLDILRNKIKDESVDLVYLDPPFKSDANYNVLFKSAGVDAADAQVEAFKDTWQWGDAAEAAYDDIRGHVRARIAVSGLRKWLGDNGIMAYLAMMGVRLVEMQRALKPGGSIYLHCDPSASHYLKILMDSIFGGENFTSELIWKRTNSRSTAGKWPSLHDVILFYGGPTPSVFNRQIIPADPHKLPHTLITGIDGLKYQTFELTGPGLTKNGESGRPWRQFDPGSFGRHWAVGHEELESLEARGLIHWPARNGFPRRRASEPFVAEDRKVTVGDVWTDIDRLNQTASERLGYPTQKPLALLRRIIEASSNEDATILDPFCGCGTAVDAAESLGRNWIGIDIAHYAVSLIEERLARWRPDARYEVYGRPTTLAGARELASRDKHQFQWWASWLLGAQSYTRDERKGADQGIDGRISYRNGPFGDGHIILSVKGGENVGVHMVRDLRGVIEREEAEMGILISLAEPTGPMHSEAVAAGFVRNSAHGRLRRIQIVTIEDIFAGRMPQLPPIPRPERYQSSPKRASRDQYELLFPVSNDAPVAIRGNFIDPRFMSFGSKAKRKFATQILP